jgi:hypothetical protein
MEKFKILHGETATTRLERISEVLVQGGAVNRGLFLRARCRRRWGL